MSGPRVGVAKFKSAPRPILKKHASAPIRFMQRMTPQFFGGNESMHGCLEEEEDEVERGIKLLEDDEVSREPERFRKSHLPQGNAKITRKNRRRTISAVYIFHSKEINKEIIRALLSSTDGFIDDFKRAVVGEHLSDEQLYSSFKEQFVPQLREFLVGKEVDRNSQHMQIGVTLSQPTIADVERFRRRNRSDKLSQSQSASDVERTFMVASVDIHGKKNEKNLVSASLPNSSFLDSYNNELKVRETVLLKTMRSNSLVPGDKDGNFSQHSYSPKSGKEKNKSIVSNATTTKKIVRFADAFGLDLENVKIITNNSFVEAFSHDYHDDDDDDDEPEDDGSPEFKAANSNPFLVLIPLFGLRKTHESNVKLDDFLFDYQNRIIKCMVKVRNVCFEKRVFARITFNNWKTYYDLDAIYIKSDTPVMNPVAHHNELKLKPTFLHDYFGFCIIIPEKQTLLVDSEVKQSAIDESKLRIEFALCYSTGHNTYWDNNAGENYKFQCFYNISN